MSFADYSRLARQLPPRVVAERALGLVRRRTRAARERMRDELRPTHPTGSSQALVLYARLSREDVQEDISRDARKLSAHYMRHEFDILGSGWTTVARGMNAPGIEGVGYPAHPKPSHDTHGAWLRTVVNRANAAESAHIWRLISSGAIAHPGYEPIDWQLDFRSGWRWSERTHFDRIRIGPALGADIKIPWELSRMQHLPVLALSLFSPGADDSAMRELRAQILDFIAANPPRFGVAWASPMEIAIRATNWIVALTLAASAGYTLENDDAAPIVAASIDAHARHVLAHLEWSPEPRSNHYLAEIVGLIFMAAHLPPCAETDAWLGFAIRELEREILLQFRDDGGNYEASTAYHRLSAEMALYALAVIAGQSSERLRSIANAARTKLRVRPPQPRVPLEVHSLEDCPSFPIGKAAITRLERAAEFAADVARTDGTSLLIGDNDSASLLKLKSIADSTESNAADDHESLLALAAALFDREDLCKSGRGQLAGTLGVALSRGRRLPRTRPPFPSRTRRTGLSDPYIPTSEDPRCDRSRHIRVPIPVEAMQGLTTSAYPYFGLYIWRSSRLFVSVRCFDPDIGGVWSHSHDDNLALTIRLDDQDIVGDPGTYCYTSFPEFRSLWRSASAHEVPRQKGATAIRADSLFAVKQLARARCIGFGPEGFAGVLEGDGWSVERRLIIRADGLDVYDCADPGPIEFPARGACGVFMTNGYGKKTARPVPVL